MEKASTYLILPSNVSNVSNESNESNESAESPRSPSSTMAQTDVAATGQVLGDLTLSQLMKLSARICKADAKTTLVGEIEAYQLYEKSKMVKRMVDECAVVGGAITFKMPVALGITSDDVDDFERIISEKEWDKHFYEDGIFDRFPAKDVPKKRIKDNTTQVGKALSVGVLRLVDYFEMESLRERIIGLTNKKPSPERVMAIDDAYHDEAGLNGKTMAYFASLLLQDEGASKNMSDLFLDRGEDTLLAVQTTRATLYQLDLSWDAMATMLAVVVAGIGRKDPESHNHHGYHNHHGCSRGTSAALKPVHMAHSGPKDKGRAMPQ